MKFDIEKINAILNNVGDINSDDYELNGKAFTLWLNTFVFNNESFKSLSLYDSTKKMNAFTKCGDYSEENFKKWFPDFKYTKYIDPNTFTDCKRVSLKKCQKIAFELQEHIPMEHELLSRVLLGLYNFEKEFSFDKLILLVGDFDQDLSLRMLIYQQTLELLQERQKRLVS